MEYYSAIKKNEIMSFAEKEKQLEITTSEVSQKEKDKHHMISLISYVESKHDTNEPIYEIETDQEHRK